MAARPCAVFAGSCPVPCHRRNGGPIRLADDSRSCWSPADRVCLLPVVRSSGSTKILARRSCEGGVVSARTWAGTRRITAPRDLATP
jgi:hypothetical protein